HARPRVRTGPARRSRGSAGPVPHAGSGRPEQRALRSGGRAPPRAPADCRLLSMAVLESVVQRDDVFDRRRGLVEGLINELRERTAEVARGGGEKATERHRSRGKLTARERIDRLVDPGGAFLELNALAAWDMYEGQAPAAGIVTGIGTVEGRECVI